MSQISSKAIIFRVEIFSPNSDTDVLKSFSSEQSLFNIERGDFIDPTPWMADKSPSFLLSVISLEHHISHFSDSHLEHILRVYTQKYDDVYEARKGMV